MKNFGADESGDTPFTRNMIKSDDPIILEHESDNQAGGKGSRSLRVIISWNIFDNSPEPWRNKLGFCLTFLYVVGVIVIISYYYINFRGEGRPTIVDVKLASSDNVGSDSLRDYTCSCDLPPHIQADAGSHSRIKTFNRCYRPEEVTELEVLQFGQYTAVDVTLENINTKAIRKRTFKNGYILNWESYELITPREIYPFDNTTFDNPLARLNSGLSAKGYIGSNGFISVAALANQPFFTVPQGFVKAYVDYNCSSCEACQKLWARYNYTEATKRRSSFDDKEDSGWILCYNSSLEPRSNSSAECRGSCRFFRTHSLPWGISMHKFAIDLKRIIPDTANIYFQSRAVYANVSQFSPAPEYEMSFLEIEREGTSWAKLVEEFGEIPDCTEQKDEVLICSGTSVCVAAAVYSPDYTKSDAVEILCTNYATEVDFQIDEKQCGDMVQNLNMTTHNESVLAHVCGRFDCKKVQTAQVYWDNYVSLLGEVALSRLILHPAVETSFIPGLCSNNYTQVYVNYTESGKEILGIYEMNCTTGKSKGCWLTGRYKKMESTRNDPWAMHDFSREEVSSTETMFACYRLDKMSRESYLYDKIGIVAGIIGSWLLMLSCVFWTATRAVPTPRPSVHSSNCRSNSTSSSTTTTTPADGVEMFTPDGSRPIGFVEPDRRSINVFNR